MVQRERANTNFALVLIQDPVVLEQRHAEVVECGLAKIVGPPQARSVDRQIRDAGRPVQREIGLDGGAVRSNQIHPRAEWQFGCEAFDLDA